MLILKSFVVSLFTERRLLRILLTPFVTDPGDFVTNSWERACGTGFFVGGKGRLAEGDRSSAIFIWMPKNVASSGMAPTAPLSTCR